MRSKCQALSLSLFIQLVLAHTCTSRLCSIASHLEASSLSSPQQAKPDDVCIPFGLCVTCYHAQVESGECRGRHRCSAAAGLQACEQSCGCPGGGNPSSLCVWHHPTHSRQDARDLRLSGLHACCSSPAAQVRLHVNMHALLPRHTYSRLSFLTAL